jgi:hypothetical protein
VTQGLTLDAGALIALDRNERLILALLAQTDANDAPISIPATALAQAIRNPRRQVRLARLIRQATTTVIPLDQDDAAAVGRLLATSGSADIADAHVVLCARRTGQRVVTSDPNDLTALDPGVEVITV